MGSGFQRQQNELRKARATMANLVNSGQVNAIDRWGTPIKKGDLVMVHLSPDPLLQVMDIKPPFDPRQPADQITIVFAMQIPIAVRAGLPIASMTIMGSALEMDPDEPPAPDADPEKVAAQDKSEFGPKLVLTDAPDLPPEVAGVDRPE